MNTINIRRVFEMRGRDEEELVRRIGHFRSTVRAQHGAILNVKMKRGTGMSETHASVLYQIPLSSMHLKTDQEEHDKPFS